MVDDVATTWGGKITLGRAPANNEILLGNANGSFTLTASSSISPSIQTLLDGISNTQGSILYRSASAWAALAPGTSGNVLSTNGASANPSWVAQTSPYTPVWTDGIKTSADQSRTSSTALTDATDLSFSVAANTYYAFQFMILTTGGSGGLRVSVTCPSSPTSFLFGPQGIFGSTTSGAAVDFFTTPPASWAISSLVGGYLNNGSNAGTVQFQFAQSVSNATATTIRKGSWFQYRTV